MITEAPAHHTATALRRFKITHAAWLDRRLRSAEGGQISDEREPQMSDYVPVRSWYENGTLYYRSYADYCDI